jgi:16S rRNA (guanine527-N7)-methyltransferase
VASDLELRLSQRASEEGVTLPPELSAGLLAYLQLLQHWNRRINLTSLSDPDEAIARLLLEPVAAAAYLPRSVPLADLGSGGGSPAIPLALALGSGELLMVESRFRKAAFLREAAREVGLNATVEADRFEAVATRASFAHRFGLVSVRAIRPDTALMKSAVSLLQPGGLFALFQSAAGPDRPDDLSPDLAWRETRPLLPSTQSQLTVLFHVEHP